jgi:ubiquinone/menaquinone biosynthesis C-methylase UbiE
VAVVLKQLQPAAGDNVLDIGCGVGTFAYHSAKAGAKATGVDYSTKSIETARKLCEKFGVANRTQFVVSSALTLPFADNTFNKIVAADFIEHIYDNEKVVMLKEIVRVAKPGARLVIFTPNKIREDLGTLYNKILNKLFGEPIPINELHYGLITRSKYEAILKQFPISFKHVYNDTSRPYLARIPLLRNALAFNLTWVGTITKQ